MEALIERLHAGGYSRVIEQRGEIRTFTRRGVADLYEVYRHHPEWLAQARVADKVIGCGAAALLVLGNVSEVYVDVISTPALTLLREAGIPVRFEREVPHIENRTKSGWCPLETACDGLRSASEMYPVIQQFMARQNGASASVASAAPSTPADSKGLEKGLK